MGCNQSQSDNKPVKVNIKVTKSVKDPNLNKNDYMVKGITTNSLIIKDSGSISGQQFIVEDSKDCHIFLLDFLECVFVDQCSNISLVIGPTNASVFIRNCDNCLVVAVCQQLRLRDCHNCKIYLFSSTGPIIESSSGIGFSCFDFNYFGIESHIQKTDLCKWNNKWFEVFDFTRDNNDNLNYYYMQPHISSAEIISDRLNIEYKSQLADRGVDIGAMISTPIEGLPLTTGNLKFSLSNENKDKALIICSVEFESILCEVMNAWKLNKTCVVIRSLMKIFKRDELIKLMGRDAYTRSILNIELGVICLEVSVNFAVNKKIDGEFRELIFLPDKRITAIFKEDAIEKSFLIFN